MSTTSDHGWDDEVRMLRDSAHAMFDASIDTRLRETAEAGIWPASLWRMVEDMGLPDAAAPESAGGASLPLSAALSIAFECGFHGVPLPVVETQLARWAAGRAGLALGTGAATVALLAPGAALEEDRGLLRVSAEALHVPWGIAARLVLACPGPEPKLFVLDAGDAEATAGRNLAGEPRDTLVLRGTPLPRIRTADIAAADLTTLEHAQIAARSMQMAGAMQRILDLTARYAEERVQFGKPLARLQVIQQYLAVMAEQVVSCRVAAEYALEQLQQRDEDLAAAAAKVRCSGAVELVARHAHQIHGAMGFTHEHPLHWYTRRLWSWRDEYGNESAWARKLTQQVVARDSSLWSIVSGCSDTPKASA